MKGELAVRMFLYGLLVSFIVGCSPANNGSEESTAGATAATETTATQTAPAAASSEEERPMSEYENKVAEIRTTKGDIHIRFFPDVAPDHVRNFIDLAEKGFYNGTKFHRVIPGFMIQGGDPNTKTGDAATWGMGGAEKRLRAEFNSIPHRRGIVSMARSQDENSASSQFFIVVADSEFLDNKYTVFGQVTKGMEVADAIVSAPRGPNDRPNDPVEIKSITIRAAAGAAETGPAPR